MFKYGDNLVLIADNTVTDRIIRVQQRQKDGKFFDEVFTLETDGNTYTRQALARRYKVVEV